jgi:hypothetical protein
LSFLEPHGICVAIVPQSCAMNTKKGNLNVKERIMKHHTLKAVMSMPDKLFDDNEKSSVTCVMVFEAHKPHTETSKTWFGYWKDDGFIKQRPYGRSDSGRYEKEIKKHWLESYRSKKEIEGFSVLRYVSGEDEWLVEAYMKTRFEDLSDKNFEDTLRTYSTFLYSNGLAKKVSSEAKNDKRLAFNFKNWKSVSLKDLFEVKGSKTTDKRTLDEEHSSERTYPYITTQAENNGARVFYDTFTDEGNILTIDSAVVGFCAYQPLNFSASDHVEKLVPNFEMNVYRGLFLTTIISLEQYRYSYGRKYNQDRIRDTEIKLPFKDGKIDWNFIDDYVKGLPNSKYVEITP